jgi:hypothetical protein
MTTESPHYQAVMKALAGDPDSKPPAEKLRVLTTICQPGLAKHEPHLRAVIERMILGNKGRMKTIMLRHILKQVPPETARFIDAHRAVVLRYTLYYAQMLDGYKAELKPLSGDKPKRVVIVR